MSSKLRLSVYSTFAFSRRLFPSKTQFCFRNFLHLVLLPFVNLDEKANKFYDRKHDLYHTAFLTRCYTQHALRPYVDSEMNHIRHFIKIPFIYKGVSISSIYLAYLEIIQLNYLFLIILKIKNLLLFVINIINLLEVQYSISINWLLILILVLRLQIHEIVKFQNSVMNQQVILLQEI